MGLTGARATSEFLIGRPWKAKLVLQPLRIVGSDKLCKKDQNRPGSLFVGLLKDVSSRAGPRLECLDVKASNYPPFGDLFCGHRTSAMTRRSTILSSFDGSSRKRIGRSEISFYILVSHGSLAEI